MYEGTKIKFTFLTLDVDIANDVFKGLLIYVRLMVFPEYLKKHLGIKKTQTIKYNKTPNTQQPFLAFSFCQATTQLVLIKKLKEN